MQGGVVSDAIVTSANNNVVGSPNCAKDPSAQAQQQALSTPKRLHVSNIPFRFRDPDLRNMFGVRELLAPWSWKGKKYKFCLKEKCLLWV